MKNILALASLCSHVSKFANYNTFIICLHILLFLLFWSINSKH